MTIMIPVMTQNLGHRFKDNCKAETNYGMMADNRKNGHLYKQGTDKVVPQYGKCLDYAIKSNGMAAQLYLNCSYYS